MKRTVGSVSVLFLLARVKPSKWMRRGFRFCFCERRCRLLFEAHFSAFFLFLLQMGRGKRASASSSSIFPTDRWLPPPSNKRWLWFWFLSSQLFSLLHRNLLSSRTCIYILDVQSCVSCGFFPARSVRLPCFVPIVYSSVLSRLSLSVLVLLDFFGLA